MKELSKEDIEFIQSDEMNEAFWYFELGRNLPAVEDTPETDHYFMKSFYDFGKKMWDEFEAKAKTVLCDPTTMEPKEFVKEVSEGSGKDIVSAIVGVYMTTYSLAIGIAIPLAALTLKKGLGRLCSQ